MRLATIFVIMMLLLVSAAPISSAGSGSRWAELRNPVVKAVEAAGPAIVNISTEKIVTVRTRFPRSFLRDDSSDAIKGYQ